MGKFSGYLIASDIDGTFVGTSGETQGNVQAIKYFTENGGKFTFATGRLASHLLENDMASLINAPACLANGAAVYDYSEKKLLMANPLEYTLGEFIENAVPLFENATSISFFTKADLLGKAVNTGRTMLSAEDVSRAGEIIPDLLNERMLKIIVRHKCAEDAIVFKKRAAESPFFNKTFISRAWSIGVEFNSPIGTKGAALSFIKSILPDVHTTVGIGDYENDATLLQSADIAAAVEGAVPELFEYADILVTNANGQAIADLISKLEKRIGCN